MRARIVKRAMLPAALFLSAAACLFGSGYETLESKGTVLLKRRGEAQRYVKAGEELHSGDIIWAKRDSALVFSLNETRYMLYPYSSAQLGERPSLCYGKLGTSHKAPQEALTGSDFIQLHFYLIPQPAQGKTLKVVVKSADKDLILSGSISGRGGYRNELAFFPASPQDWRTGPQDRRTGASGPRTGDSELSGGSYRALTGFDIEMKPEKYTLKISVQNAAGSMTEIIYPFYLKKAKLESGEVYLSEETLELLEPSERKTEEVKVLYQILSRVSYEALWKGSFSFPLPEPDVISSYGKARKYFIENSPSFTRHHRGLDLRGSTGERVIAPNEGVVVFAAPRITTGYTVVIDHGQGVFSLFFHLNAILTVEGASLEKGEAFAEVGATGIAAGEHLHWGMFVGGAYVDPLDWVKYRF